MKYDKKYMKNMSDNLKVYLNTMESYVIIRGVTDEEYDESIKLIKKLIKKLKKKKGKKVFDKKRYRQLIESGKLDEDAL